MEIEFNPNIGKAQPVQPAARQEAMRRIEDNSASFVNIDGLEKQLKEVPAVRSERVEQARAAVQNVPYPPDTVLNSIATLLALKLK